MYPNPSTGNFTLIFEGFDERTFALFDATGKQIDFINAQSSPVSVNYTLQSGIYYVKENQTGQNLKIVVTHE